MFDVRWLRIMEHTNYYKSYLKGLEKDSQNILHYPIQ